MSSKTDLHRFIRTHLELNGCKVEDNDGHFSVKYPDQMLPTKYTYSPEVSESQKIELVTPGSRFFNTIIKDSLNQGIVSSVEMTQGSENLSESVRNFFVSRDERCSECAKGNHENCPKLIRCAHKMNGASVKNVSMSKKSAKTVFQFYFLVELSNRLRKTDDIVAVAVSSDDEILSPIDIHDARLGLKETSIEKKGDAQKHLKKAVNYLKHGIKKKTDFFNKQIDYEIAKKMQSIERKFNDERMEKLLNKEKFKQEEWEKTLKRTIDSEKKSLGTTVSVKLINCLVIKAPVTTYSLELSNGGTVNVPLIEKMGRGFHPKCHTCSKSMTEGFATEDRRYVCGQCKIECIETGKLFSPEAKGRLSVCNTSGEYLSEDAGFRCSGCNLSHSKRFMYRCSGSGEPVCAKCYDFCSYCDRIFSARNMNACKESSFMYCKAHSSQCSGCGSPVGLDKARFSGEASGIFCSCIESSQCRICEDHYSEQHLEGGKCQACRNLKMVLSDSQEIAQIRLRNKEYERTVDWMVGVNRFNKIIIARGEPVDSVFVANPHIIRFIKKARVSDL